MLRQYVIIGIVVRLPKLDDQTNSHVDTPSSEFKTLSQL